MTQFYPTIGGIYDHYKGGRYEVLTLAKHTESDEVLVIYKSLHFGSIHARPLSMWFDKVKIQGHDGAEIEVYRFTDINYYPYRIDIGSHNDQIFDWTRPPGRGDGFISKRKSGSLDFKKFDYRD